MRTRGVQGSNTAPYHNTQCRTSVAVHNAAVQHSLSTVSPDSKPTIVVLQTDASLVSKDNFIPFCHPHPFFITPLAAVVKGRPSKERLADSPLCCNWRRMVRADTE
ncbi:hypothetical protein TNCV_1051321 [Trichonephila clavipes]|nr:hypothetical protein TNCV_1051321 [Trichonephila clavipes]